MINVSKDANGFISWKCCFIGIHFIISVWTLKWFYNDLSVRFTWTYIVSTENHRCDLNIINVHDEHPRITHRVAYRIIITHNGHHPWRSKEGVFYIRNRMPFDVKHNNNNIKLYITLQYNNTLQYLSRILFVSTSSIGFILHTVYLIWHNVILYS